MFYEPRKRNHGLPHDPFKAIVVGVHIDERFIKDGLLDTAAMRPIARAGYHDYFVSTPESKFSIRRPKGGAADVQ